MVDGITFNGLQFVYYLVVSDRNVLTIDTQSIGPQSRGFDFKAAHNCCFDGIKYLRSPISLRKCHSLSKSLRPSGSPVHSSFV